jgi:hypothetical protein
MSDVLDIFMVILGIIFILLITYTIYIFADGYNTKKLLGQATILDKVYSPPSVRYDVALKMPMPVSEKYSLVLEMDNEIIGSTLVDADFYNLYEIGQKLSVMYYIGNFSKEKKLSKIN